MSTQILSKRHLLIGGVALVAASLLAVANISSGTPVAESSADTFGSISAEVLPDVVRPTYQDPQDPNVTRFADTGRIKFDKSRLSEHNRPD